MNIGTTNNEKEIYKLLVKFDNCFPQTISSRVGNLETYAAKLAENAFVYFAMIEDKCVGFAAIYANDYKNKIAFLTQIAVDPSYRGLQVGAELLVTCMDYARFRGMSKMNLQVDTVNLNAITFYKRFGFYITEYDETSTYMSVAI